MACPIFENCSFFNDQMANMPSMADHWKNYYCNDRYEECARYKVKQATGKSHPTLMPNEDDKVDSAIEELQE